MITDKEIYQTADDEKQQDWNDKAYEAIYKDGFIDGAKWAREKVSRVELPVSPMLAGEYIGQKYLSMAETIGDLKKQIAHLPDNMEFGFLNQPRQQIAIREYSDGYKCAVFNGTSKHSG